MTEEKTADIGELVERRILFGGNMVAMENGDWVRHRDYAALETRCAELEKERDAFKRGLNVWATDASELAGELSHRDRIEREPVVKALEWVDGYVAETPFGTYTISEGTEDDEWQWTFHCYPYGSPDETKHPSREGAKAAAQADHERRILSALASAPERVEATTAWPAGCVKPNSCSRHKQCMYANCKNEGRDIRSEVEASLASREAT